MTVLARRVVSLPVHTAGDTWLTIVNLLADPGTLGHERLLAASNVAAMLISEGYTAGSPVDVAPVSGPRVRIYTLHGDDAVEADDALLPLPTKPVSGDGWTVSLPCGEDDLQDVRAVLAGMDGFTVHAIDQETTAAASHSTAASPADVFIDLSGGLQ